MSDTALKKKVTTAFVKELESFKRGGYGFLFEGTQREAFDAYLDGLKEGHREGYFEIPTGVGKTALFIAIIGCYLKATQNISDAPTVLIHEPSNDLVMQTALAFADFMPAIAKTIEAEDDKGKVMDFDNSDVELHYSRRKGAKNDHKVLITTYQSQAADERKRGDRPKTFTLENFGLVIHDEAHYLTGPKYGPAAVDKFKGAIQLGVTATPEYSDDKTVANKLAYRYYNLPLNTAIERGDLCHVRPILIKTNLKGKNRINLERARQFLEERHGKPLSNAQLEQLLNQKVRNQAIIKAYLTGSHPDTEERFLGQTGMIFAGGITHCDDFIRNAHDVLSQPKYRPIKRWLADEGLALIAPIHSAVPKDGIDIAIGGEKRKCTKDQIKELHRQGKILLIISDQELKLGTDFPRDSFIAETVDRFSVPDATQRMGRGFRLDRGNPRYHLLPNPGKSCAAANVIDETTHEMYQGTPHYPIHAIEILHGAVHRPPMRRQGAMTTRQFRKNPPEVTESVEELGFQLISRVEALRAIAKQFEAGKKQPLPLKDPEKNYGTKELTDALRSSRGRVRPLLSVIEQAYGQQNGNQEIEVDSVVFPINQMGYYAITGGKEFCIDKSCTPLFSHLMHKGKTGKTAQQLGIVEAIEEMRTRGVTASFKSMKPLFDELEAAAIQAREAGQDHVIVRGEDFLTKHLEEKVFDSGRSYFCVDAAEMDHLQSALTSENWLNRGAVIDALKESGMKVWHAKVKPLYETIINVMAHSPSDEANIHINFKGRTHDIPKQYLFIKPTSHGDDLHIHQDFLDGFKQILEAREQKIARG